MGYTARAQQKSPEQLTQKVREELKKSLPLLASPDFLVIQKGVLYLSIHKGYLGLLSNEEIEKVVEKLCVIIPSISRDKKLRSGIIDIVWHDINIIREVKNYNKKLVTEYCNILQQEKQDLTDKEAVMMISCLGKIGANAEDAVSLLIEIVKKKTPEDDPYFYPPCAALNALHAILGEKVIPVLCNVIRDKAVDYAVRVSACLELRGIGKNSLPAIQELTTDQNPEVRKAVFYSLPNYILEMPQFYTIRNKALNDPDEEARLAICSRLLRLDVKETEDILKVLKTLAQEGSTPSIKNEAAELLKKAICGQEK